MFTGHHFRNGVYKERVLAHWAKHSGVTLKGDSDFLQGLNGGSGGRVGSCIGGVGGGSEMVDETMEIGASKEEIVIRRS